MNSEQISRMKSFRRLPKFKPGKVIESPYSIVNATKQGQWLYFGHRVYHPAWISNYNFGCVMSYLARNEIRVAIRNPEYPYVFKAKVRGADEAAGWFASCTEIPGEFPEAQEKADLVKQCEAMAEWKSGRKGCRYKVLFFSAPAESPAGSLPAKQVD